jgi:hypothetical protein
VSGWLLISSSCHFPIFLFRESRTTPTRSPSSSVSTVCLGQCLRRVCISHLQPALSKQSCAADASVNARVCGYDTVSNSTELPTVSRVKPLDFAKLKEVVEAAMPCFTYQNPSKRCTQWSTRNWWCARCSHVVGGVGTRLDSVWVSGPAACPVLWCHVSSFCITCLSRRLHSLPR